MTKKTILVTGAGGSAGYNFIDSLKLVPKTYTVIGVDTNREHLALSNADHKYLVPPNSQPQAYIEALNTIIDRHHVQLIHPQPDVEVAFIAKHQKELHAPVFLPSPETIEKCHNKFQAAAIFQNNKVPVPRSFLLNKKSDVKKALEELQKGNDQAKVWIRAIRGAGSKAALPVTTVDQALSWIAYWDKTHAIGLGDFMAAEYLPGKEYAFQSVWQNGQLLVSQARERCEYVFGNLTPSGQTSSPSVARTVHHEGVNDVATRAVRAVDPQATGIFCVDLKENTAGQPCLLEINPGRFFTTSNFFSTAGCNMPHYYIQLALGEKTDDTFQPYNNLEPDLYWLRIIDMGYKLIRQNDWGIDGNFQADH